MAQQPLLPQHQHQPFRLADLSRSGSGSGSCSSSSSSSSSSGSSSLGSSRRQRAAPYLFAGISSSSSSSSSIDKGKSRAQDSHIDGAEDDDETPFVDPELAAATPTRRASPSAGSRTPSPTHFLSPEPAHPAPPLRPITTPGPEASASASSGQRERRRRKHSDGGGLRDKAARSGQHGAARRRQQLRGRERALWEWVNVEDLDVFLAQVYEYYLGKGLFCILLARGLNLLTVGFVIVFSSFLLRCVDYSALVARSGLGESWSIEEVIIPRCVASASPGAWALSLLFLTFYAYQLAAFLAAIPGLLRVHRFYTHLLNIPDEDVQTTAWGRVVSGIEVIREGNSLASGRVGQAKLDAHDIANRLMRQENYLIALLSPPSPAPLSTSDPSGTPSSLPPIPPPRLNLSLGPLLQRLPAPLRAVATTAGLREKQWLTRVVVWNLRFCLIEFLFEGGAGEVRRGVLKARTRGAMAEKLKRRLRFMALVNLLLGPLIALYLVIYSFFRYFEEYHKNPSSLTSRAYTPQARWTFREFNELRHVFDRRLRASEPVARKYVDQFPKERMALLMRFMSFIAGSFAAVLLVLSILDPSALVSLEITPHRTVLFYLTLFGAILAVTRASRPPDGEGTYDPEVLMRGVGWYTHWMPDDWEGKLHTTFVLDQFSQLFTFKLLLFLTEIASVFLTPLLLAYALPDQAEQIVDFFREFTVQVDGVGAVCSFGVFDFKPEGKGGGRKKEGGAEEKAKGKREKMMQVAADGKMERSFLNFKANNPGWAVQDPTSSIYLSRLQDAQGQQYTSHLLAPPPATAGRFGPPSASRAAVGQAQGFRQVREGFMLSSNFLAEHNVPAYAAVGSTTSPFTTMTSPHTRASPAVGRHAYSASSSAAPRAALVAGEVFDEEREQGWDDASSRVPVRGGQASGIREEVEDSLTDDDGVDSEAGQGREDDDEDQELLKMLGNIYTTRLGR